MEAVAFQKIKGHREDSVLLWVPDECHLYVRKYNRREKEVFECYQRILKKNSKNQAIECAAMVEIKDGICTRVYKQHACHPNHKQIFDDLQARNSIIDTCVAMKKTVEGLPVNVPAQAIFTLEMSKLVAFVDFHIVCISFAIYLV